MRSACDPDSKPLWILNVDNKNGISMERPMTLRCTPVTMAARTTVRAVWWNVEVIGTGFPLGVGGKEDGLARGRCGFRPGCESAAGEAATGAGVRGWGGHRSSPVRDSEDRSRWRGWDNGMRIRERARDSHDRVRPVRLEVGCSGIMGQHLQQLNLEAIGIDDVEPRGSGDVGRIDRANSRSS